MAAKSGYAGAPYAGLSYAGNDAALSVSADSTGGYAGAPYASIPFAGNDIAAVVAGALAGPPKHEGLMRNVGKMLR